MQGPPHVIFYAGVPTSVDGLPLGTLCVIDHAPRDLTQAQITMLEQLAVQVEGHLRSRRLSARLEAANRELARSEEQLRAVLHAMHDGMVMQAQSGAITLHNPAACRILGLTVEQLEGRTSMDPRWQATRADGTPCPGEEHPSMVALRTGQPVRDVVMGVHAGGTPRWIRINAEPLFMPGHNEPHAAVTSFHDVTEDRLREQQLRLAREVAEQTLRARSEFLAVMSHELRTPMNGVVGMAELMLVDGARDAEQHAMLSTIQDSGRALLRIIDDVLEDAKIEAGRKELSSVPCGLDAIAADVMRLVAVQAKSKGLAVSIHREGPDPMAVLADPDALRQVLTNLVGNALKFTHQGSVVVRLSRLEDDCRIEVTDTGIGLSAEQVPRLFQRFSQADFNTGRRYGGTGLGLVISKGLVEAMGGTIGVISEVGKGSTFWVRLPAAVLTPVPAGQPAAPVSAPAAAPLRVLLVEDNPVNQRVSQGMLTRLGHQVHLAENGVRALSAMGSHAFDGVLMDVQMPEMDGLEATRTIRREWSSSIPIIALTASVMSAERSACLEAGMNLVLPKPLTMDALRTALAQLRAA